MGQFTDADLDEVDALPTPHAIALGFVSAVTVAECAARAAIAEVKKNRQGRSLHVLVTIANGLTPPIAIAESLEGWARAGARQGIIDAWAGDIRARPLECGVSGQEMYCCAYALTSTVVTRMKQGAW